MVDVPGQAGGTDRLVVAERRVNLHHTVLTVNTGAEAPAVRTVPRIDWTALFGVGCKPLLGGALSLDVLIDQGLKATTDRPVPRREILPAER